MKVVINKCYGGFGVTEAVLLKMRELGHEGAKKETLTGEKYDDSDVIAEDYRAYSIDNIKRDDPVLIKVIEEIGVKESSGQLASLEIVEIPDDVIYKIDEYDGIETIHEQHRTW